MSFTKIFKLFFKNFKNSRLPPGGHQCRLGKQILAASGNSKIGSLNNVKHRPGGGNVKIETQKLKIESKSKIGSMDNVKHKPQGGNVKIHNQRLRHLVLIF